jgi:hypothetical protein
MTDSIGSLAFSPHSPDALTVLDGVPVSLDVTDTGSAEVVEAMVVAKKVSESALLTFALCQHNCFLHMVTFLSAADILSLCWTCRMTNSNKSLKVPLLSFSKKTHLKG